MFKELFIRPALPAASGLPSTKLVAAAGTFRLDHNTLLTKEIAKGMEIIYSSEERDIDRFAEFAKTLAEKYGLK